MTAATRAVEIQSSQLTEHRLLYRLIGLSVAALMPALFWVAVVAGIGHAAGLTPTAPALAVLGASIAVFLGAVCAPIMLKTAR
jgi:hypothetical protein